MSILDKFLGRKGSPDSEIDAALNGLLGALSARGTNMKSAKATDAFAALKALVDEATGDVIEPGEIAEAAVLANLAVLANHEMEITDEAIIAEMLEATVAALPAADAESEDAATEEETKAFMKAATELTEGGFGVADDILTLTEEVAAQKKALADGLAEQKVAQKTTAEAVLEMAEMLKGVAGELKRRGVAPANGASGAAARLKEVMETAKTAPAPDAKSIGLGIIESQA